MSHREPPHSAPDWDATAYDRVADPQTRWGVAVLDRLPLRGGETVLDAGCGTGRVTQHLLQRLPHGHVVALDASRAMLQQARQRLGADPRLRFVAADLSALGPGDLGDGVAPLDAVFSTATLHWVGDHDRLFANLAAVLRQGGRLVAQCGGEGNLAGLSQTVRELGVERLGTGYYASVGDTERRLLAAGFREVSVWSAPEPTPFADGGRLAAFLETVCLREAVASMSDRRRRAFVKAVAARLPGHVIDYVRLNIDAVRG